MLEKIKKMDIIVVLLCLLSLNSLRDINIAQSLVVIGIFAVYSYNKWLTYIKKPDELGELKTEIENIRSQMSGIMIKNSLKPKEQEFKRFF